MTGFSGGRRLAPYGLALVPGAEPFEEAVAGPAEVLRSMWSTLVSALPRLALAAVLILLGWLAGRALRVVLRRWWCRTRTPSFSEVMSRLVSWSVMAATVGFAVTVTFPSVRPVDLLTGLGFFSIAIGFAFQDILENTLSGVLLLFRQPFRAGDEIEVQKQIGRVEAITIRETRLVTYDGVLVVIPNRDVYKSVILVRTAYTSRRVELTVDVGIGADLAAATDALTRGATGVAGVHQAPPPRAVACGLGRSVITLRLWFWTDPQEAVRLDAVDRVVTNVRRRLEEAGVDMPAQIVEVEATTSLADALRPWAAEA